WTPRRAGRDRWRAAAAERRGCRWPSACRCPNRDRGKDEGRRILGEAGDAHGPAHGLGDRLEALEAAVGPISAEALDGGIDEPRINLGESLVAEPETVQRSGAEVLDQNVRLGDHLLE